MLKLLVLQDLFDRETAGIGSDYRIGVGDLV
jgi:hypothetical protein